MTATPTALSPCATPVIPPARQPQRAIIHVDDYPAFPEIVKIWMANLYPDVAVLAAASTCEFRDLLQEDAYDVIGIITDGQLGAGATAYDIVRIASSVLTHPLPFLVLTATPEWFPVERFMWPPVAVYCKGRSIKEAIVQLVDASQ